MGKVYAWMIWKGTKTYDDVPTKYQEATAAAYLEIFGVTCPGSEDTTDDTDSTTSTAQKS